MISVKNLKKIFKPSYIASLKGAQPFTAVNGISFDINPGEIVGILGPNGAGKTTTMHMLLDTLTPTSGTIEYFGLDLKSHRSEIMQQVGFASTYINLPERLSIEENLDIIGLFYQMPSYERKKSIDRLLHQFGIAQHRKKLVGSLSAGQVTRTMLAKAFLPNPKIVLLDEPTAALDPDIAHDLRQFILQQQKECNTTILLASHNMEEVTQMCDRVLVLQKGVIIDQDTPENLAAQIHVTRLSLMAHNIEAIANIAQEKKLLYSLENECITIELEEKDIASFLQLLAQRSVEYFKIYIDKPSLEDYFLHVARGARS